jgi:hypothetical protein
MSVAENAVIERHRRAALQPLGLLDRRGAAEAHAAALIATTT